MILKISDMNAKELDFYYYCRKNIDIVIDKPLNEVAKKFGCGVSFIYSFFEKNNILGVKDFVKILVEEKCADDFEKQQLLELTTDNKLWKPTIATINELKTEYSNAIDQYEKIEIIAELINKCENVYGLGFGYSELAVKDFLGFLTHCKKSVHTINYDFNHDITNYIKPNSLVIFYSVRFIQKKYSDIIEKLNRIKNCHLVLVTNGSVQNPNISVIYRIENAIKYQETFGDLYFLSPVTSFYLFNTFLKTMVFEKHRADLLNDQDFVNESMSWVDIKKY
ncbi:hypothetical protein SCLARK_0013 [Spiroplasma clarkii]|uniref:MurR/RpiR family transcriptional regulator n=1 Tax=Spiroplasma clarkii TaxID=2139 RepID=A0A1Y0KZE0_9MOLU|nr:hypothetical protein [Spiroplasma clarkii]ARU90848.1 hypothetical protein SCLARK_0013 [Spiroplasma clarkii]ATX71636.1 hypothetical protein SCLAR_v1c13380 [Spiroplasma clarkii]